VEKKVNFCWTHRGAGGPRKGAIQGRLVKQASFPEKSTLTKKTIFGKRQWTRGNEPGKGPERKTLEQNREWGKCVVVKDKKKTKDKSTPIPFMKPKKPKKEKTGVSRHEKNNRGPRKSPKNTRGAGGRAKG